MKMVSLVPSEGGMIVGAFRGGKGRKGGGEEKADGTTLTADMKISPKKASRIDYCASRDVEVGDEPT